MTDFAPVKRIAVTAGIVVASLLALPGSAAINNASIGIDAAIRNIVQIKIISETAMRRAVLREPIHIGDAVTSGPNSSMQVLLRDQSVFTVGANARMTIDRFVYDPDRGTGSLAASVARGAFRFMSGRAAHTPGEVAIKTPVASIGVRGTIVEVLVGDDAIALMNSIPGYKSQASCAPKCADPNTATLVVLRGPGPKRIGNDRIGAIDIIADGRVLSVSRAGVVVVGGPGQVPQGPFPLPPTLVQYLDQSLSTTPASQTQRDQTAVIEKSVKAALNRPDPNASLALARVVLDGKSTPVALQAALANAAGSFKPGSRTFDLLMQMSFLVMKATNVPSVDSIGHELATDQGAPILRSFVGRRDVDLPEAVSQVVTYRTAGWDLPVKPVTRPLTGDTLLSTDIVPLVREVPQASPF